MNILVIVNQIMQRNEFVTLKKQQSQQLRQVS